MREYTSPIFDTRDDSIVGQLVFLAENFDEADSIVDQWSIRQSHLTASSFDLTSRRSNAIESGIVRVEWATEME